ncbi:hypothetical protein FACS189434_04060 [Bacteroidia bacterium]|nr:hypothetical protein FACS189434_04060 [Bacteroidia bacterium]
MSIEYNKNKKYSKLELMELAYQESLFSNPEHTDKPDPKVGAILTTAEGKILATAHRGELRVGEHCEYTLLERKLQSENLQGCHLYVTLEPCTDKSRKHPKRGCSTHITKARLSKVLIGISDPNPDVENQGKDFLCSKNIEVEYFHSDIAYKIRDSLKDFIEYQEEQKLKKIQEIEDQPVEYLKQTVLHAKISSFSNIAVDAFISHSKADFTYPSQDFNDWALSFGLVSKDLIPTTLGLLLFGERAEDVLPHIIFKVEIIYDDESTEIKDFGGPVTTQLPRILKFIEQKALKLTFKRNGAYREEKYDFPVEILQEAIANAIIHRDYSIEGATNYMKIDSEKIIIRSPGMPIPPLTIDDIKTMDLPSITRNPKIMYIHNRMEMAEQRGKGLRKMKELPDLGFPLPAFNLKGNVLEIIFARKSTSIPELKGIMTAGITEEDRKGLFFIEQKGKIVVKDYAEHFGLSNKTAQRRIKDLIDVGLVDKIGDYKSTHYKLSDSL